MLESETIEFKKSLVELSDGLNSIAAILNKHGSGELWFGIKNDGSPAGMDVSFLKTAKVSRRRNPLIADLLRRIHLIEAWGRGIPLILEKAPNVRFSQVAGIFITEFPRPLSVENAETGQGARAQSEAPVELTETEQRILSALEKQTLGSKELLTLLGYRQKTGNYKAAMEKLSALNLIEYTLPNKPNSRLQKYRLTAKGRRMNDEG
jgi:ATP-dependent DNA helicase RecG